VIKHEARAMEVFMAREGHGPPVPVNPNAAMPREVVAGKAQTFELSGTRQGRDVSYSVPVKLERHEMEEKGDMQVFSLAPWAPSQ
jgi:hypothetical protein